MASETFEYTFHREKTEIVGELLKAARCLHTRQRNLCRPSVVMQARLSSYGDIHGNTYWQASYGELFASGDTPDDAFTEFDKAWEGRDD